MTREEPLLRRDDPTKAPLVGHVKVTREDWLAVARDILVKDGVASVKILAISERLQVSRSSFYWYFDNRDALLDALLAEWEARNTEEIVRRCAEQARNVTEALCHFFQVFVDPRLFDQGLDFAVREWARREPRVRALIDQADRARLDAVTAMYERHGYGAAEADVRARILYFMQLGYHALEVRETLDERLARIEGYVEGFSGAPADKDACAAFAARARELRRVS